MCQKQQDKFLIYIVLIFTILTISIKSVAQEWKCEILPSEHITEFDPKSGAEITFITTNKSNDTNLYFHDNCWLFDGKIMLFNSDRTGRQEIFGYCEKSGELIRFNPAKDSPAKFPEASKAEMCCGIRRRRAECSRSQYGPDHGRHRELRES